MTPGFDPTQVDWNNPDVEYLMKDFERTMADYRDEIMSLTKSNNQLASEKSIQVLHVGNRVLPWVCLCGTVIQDPLPHK